jgi:sarcosine oxidase subunit gamma
MVEAARIHPLTGRAFAIAGATLSAAPAAERISLRARADGAKKLGKALGLTLPAKPNTSAAKDGITALWLGPDEWLLIGNEGHEIGGRLAKASGILFSGVDISHRNTAIHIEGEKAEAALNSGCPRDLSLKDFPVGACARTILAKAEVVLLRETETRFRVECWRSFSDYVWNYLADAAKSA